MDSPAPSQKMIPPTCLHKSEICASLFISPSLPMNLVSHIPLDGSSQQFPITLYSSIIALVRSFIFSPWSILVASLLDDYSYSSSVCVNGLTLGGQSVLLPGTHCCRTGNLPRIFIPRAPWSSHLQHHCHHDYEDTGPADRQRRSMVVWSTRNVMKWPPTCGIPSTVFICPF